MLLLTWHGTIVCLRNDGGGIVQVPPAATYPGAAPVDLPVEDLPALGMQKSHPGLGLLTVRPSPLGRGVSVARYGRFLCAERDRERMAFDRPSAAEWETFLPITAQDAAHLHHILANRWIVEATRLLVRRSDIRLVPEFRLVLGQTRIDLTASLPFAATAGPAGVTTLPGAGPAPSLPPPEAFDIRQGEGSFRLLRAFPRHSALVTTETWPVRSRRTAEVLALATHRHLTGAEPLQAVFEQDVAFLRDRDGLAGLEDLMERVRTRLDAPGEAGAAPAFHPPAALQPVVSLGTSCLVACTLRRMGLLAAPMPFDWLANTHGMVRHCLETDFEVLLDRSQYTSLAGQALPGEPKDGCAHAYYAREHGIRRLFNHNDPTREADYRYTQACVDRLRDLLASDGPKLFVQVREASGTAPQEFEATASLLDRLTRNATLLQVGVAQPDRRQAVPLFSVVARQGAHTLYRMAPTSQLGGEDFTGEADRQALMDLIAAHAAMPAAARIIALGDREAVMAASSRFAQDRASEGQYGHQPDGTAAIERGNQALNRFEATVGIPRRIRFGTYDRTKIGRHLTGETGIIHAGPHQCTLRLDIGNPDPWFLMSRCLPLVYLLDAANAQAPLPEQVFFAEFGDGGSNRRSANYCSSQPGSCLLPDPDFVSSGGYESLRRQMRASSPSWAMRQDTVFWRGATTGPRTHTPPGEGEADDLSWLPRLDLCRRARASPLAAHFDVGISHICQVPEPHLAARIAASDLVRPRVQRSGFLGHKGVLVIDGNTNAWSALFSALLTGACVLLVESARGFRQWYYDALQPGVNVLPVAADLGDLDEQVAWLLANDEAASRIAAAGQALAMSLTFESVMADAATRLHAWLAAAPEKA
jgi:hypothetical protein